MMLSAYSDFKPLEKSQALRAKHFVAYGESLEFNIFTIENYFLLSYKPDFQFEFNFHSHNDLNEGDKNKVRHIVPLESYLKLFYFGPTALNHTMLRPLDRNIANERKSKSVHTRAEHTSIFKTTYFG